MADTSVFEIPIDDTAFQKVLADFEKHKAGLGKLPGLWGTIGKSINAAGVSLDHQVIATVTMGAAIDRMAANQEKFLNLTRSSAYSMEGLSRHTGNVAKGLADGAASLLKWGSVLSAIGGLVGVGGLLWGVDKLAAYGAEGRRAAMGMSSTSGNIRAFGDVYGRVLGNPGGFLGSVANAQTDVRARAPLVGLGFSGQEIENSDPADLSARILDRIRTRARQTPAGMLGALSEALGWDKLGIAPDELRTLRNTGDEEWAAMGAKNAAARSGLTASAPGERAWADLVTQLGLAKDEIGVVLVNGLARVAGPLEDLSKSVVHVFQAFADNPNLGHWVHEVGEGFEWLARKIAELMGAPVNEPSSAGIPQGPTQSGLPLSDPAYRNPIAQHDVFKDFDAGTNVLGVDGGALFNKGSVRENRERTIHDFFAAKGLTEPQIAGILGNLRQESGFDPWAKRIDPKTGLPAGDQGIAQWTGARKARYRAMFGHDPADAPEQSAMQEQLSFMWWEYNNTHKEALAQIKGAKTPEDAAYAQLRYGESGNPKDWETSPQWSMERAARGNYARDEFNRLGDSSAPLRSPAPVTVQLNVSNNTSAVTSTAAGSAAAP